MAEVEHQDRASILINKTLDMHLVEDVQQFANLVQVPILRQQVVVVVVAGAESAVAAEVLLAVVRVAVVEPKQRVELVGHPSTAGLDWPVLNILVVLHLMKAAAVAAVVMAAVAAVITQVVAVGRAVSER
jgi:hypothetical protein